MSQDVSVDAAPVDGAAAKAWWPMPRRDAHGRELVRRPSDGVLLILTAALFVAMVVRSTSVSVFGANVFELIHGLPEGLGGIFAFLYHLGSLWMVAVVAVVALAFRNVLLAVTAAASGLVAALLAQLFVAWLDTETATSLPASLAATGV